MHLAPVSPSPCGEGWSRFRYPKLFFMERKYDPEWDQFLRTAILANWVAPYFYGGNTTEDRWLSPHVALFAGREVWIANYPYRSCDPNSFPLDHGVPQYRPSREVLYYIQHYVAAPIMARRKAYLQQQQPTEN